MYFAAHTFCECLAEAIAHVLRIGRCPPGRPSVIAEVAFAGKVAVTRTFLLSSCKRPHTPSVLVSARAHLFWVLLQVPRPCPAAGSPLPGPLASRLVAWPGMELEADVQGDVQAVPQACTGRVL